MGGIGWGGKGCEWVGWRWVGGIGWGGKGCEWVGDIGWGWVDVIGWGGLLVNFRMQVGVGGWYRVGLGGWWWAVSAKLQTLPVLAKL